MRNNHEYTLQEQKQHDIDCIQADIDKQIEIRKLSNKNIRMLKRKLAMAYIELSTI